MTTLYIACAHFLVLGAGIGTLVKLYRRHVTVDVVTIVESKGAL